MSFTGRAIVDVVAHEENTNGAFRVFKMENTKNLADSLVVEFTGTVGTTEIELPWTGVYSPVGGGTSQDIAYPTAVVFKAKASGHCLCSMSFGGVSLMSSNDEVSIGRITYGGLAPAAPNRVRLQGVASGIGATGTATYTVLMIK